MARIRVIVTDYYFNKPPMLSEAEYKSYKQIFQVEPTYSLWDEFALVKWSLIAVIVGTPLGLVFESLLLIPGIAGFMLFMALATGTAESMFNYQSFLNTKNKYYKGLKSAIITSVNYAEFKQKAYNL